MCVFQLKVHLTLTSISFSNLPYFENPKNITMTIGKGRERLGWITLECKSRWRGVQIENTITIEYQIKKEMAEAGGRCGKEERGMYTALFLPFSSYG
ncbi:hypothetical protein L1987_54831 [Smallanthus sonchifolius]|uniref:Uncharacterized protein n=1 Tax=Smallanthus sonchifolius TaxID=185202 RepID=A0ACB9E8W6_9ASTR|nr:hypothetical protein L1987_54831 [Smallanthus sonchifolius]